MIGRKLWKASQEKPLEPLLSEGDAIEILGLGTRPNPRGALRWLMRSKKLAYVRLARGIYGFRREDLAACIDAGWKQAGNAVGKNK